MDFVEEKKDREDDDIGVEGNSKNSKERQDSEDCEEDEDCEDCEAEELGDLPPDVACKIADSFNTEEELQTALDQAGFGDLPLILLEDGKPRLVMPSDQHNEFTRSYNTKFAVWARNRWGASGASHKIHLTNGRSRDPDVSYWGYPRCTKDVEGVLQPVAGSVPDVIIQFSWRNTQRYEEDAINDMMNRARDKQRGSKSTTRPTLGYLIKVKFSKKRRLEINGSETQDMVGLDIYRLPHGTTIADARDPNNPNASLWHYVPEGPECLITITPGDLGITGFWALMCGEYRIKASVVFETMQKFHRERQAEGLAT
jgi:hypothetical protein